MRKRMGNIHKGEEILIVVLSVALGLTICFFSPYDLAITNQGDIPIYVSSIVKAMSLVSIIVIAIVFVFLNLLLLISKTIYRLIRSLLFGLLVSGYIQMLVYNGKMPAFNANAGEFDSASLYSIINLIIMLGIVFLPVFITAINIDCEKKQKSVRIKEVVITYVSLVIVLMQLAGTIQVYIQNRKVKTTDEYPKVLTYLSYEGTTNLSKEGNIVVFVFDRLDEGWLEETMEYFPEMENMLEGFTFYRDNVSGYSLTFPSVPSMITGRMFGGETWIDYLDKAWEGDCVPELLHKNGYTVNANLDSSTTYANFKELAGKIDNLVVPTKEQIEDPSSVYKVNYLGKDGVVQTFLKYSIAKMLPYYYKDFVTKNINPDYVILTERTLDRQSSQIYNTTDLELYEYLNQVGLKVESEKKNYSFIHLNGVHNPAIEVAELSPCKEYISEDYRIDTIRGEFQIINEYLNQMKELGVFDNSTIIILGDHGKPPVSESVNKQTRITESILTGLLIKQANAPRESLKIDDDALLSNRYLPATVLECAGIDHSSFGVSIQEVLEKGLKLDRCLECYGFNGYFNEYTDWGSYRIVGPASDFSNWSYDGPAH